jgi:hypothetical protein
MRGMKKLLLVLIALTASACASTPYKDGNDLLQQCKVAVRFIDEPKNETTEAVGEGYYCIGLVRGVLDTVDVWQFADKALKNKVSPGRPCLPEESLKNIQAVRIVVKWLNEHPEQLHNGASLLVLVALRDAFPCK